jgi:hypothetical protein
MPGPVGSLPTRLLSWLYFLASAFLRVVELPRATPLQVIRQVLARWFGRRKSSSGTIQPMRVGVGRWPGADSTRRPLIMAIPFTGREAVLAKRRKMTSAEWPRRHARSRPTNRKTKARQRLHAPCPVTKNALKAHRLPVNPPPPEQPMRNGQVESLLISDSANPQVQI